MENEKQKTIPNRDSNTKSVWQLSADKKQFNFPAHASGTIYDTLIVGGGITGITTALMLQQSGQRCILAEAYNLGYGTTGGTTAHLNTFFDATYPEIKSDFGSDAAKTVADAGKEVFSIITGFIDKYKIDCDFEYKNGYLFSENEKETRQLKEILEASRDAGVQVVEERENGVPIPFEMSLLFKDQGQFHPLKYLIALAEEFVNLGGVICEDTLIRNTTFEDGLHTAQADHTEIKAKNLVYATHIPPGINLLHFRCAPYRSYVLGIKLENDNYPTDLTYDMQEPYHYFRTHVINGQKYLIVGGEDHKTGHDDPQKAFQNLETYARKYYRVASVDYQWSSQYYVPTDGLPYIGELPGGAERTYTATGFNGNGMMFGTLSAKIISEQILGKENPYAALFRPSRVKPVAGFTEFVKENADVAYRFFADRISVEEVESLKTLQLDQGIIINYHDKKLAIYKDLRGNINALSPVCTHAGCIVNFNDAEKTWDCPCHGGRFDIHGKVITGPPTKDLEQIRIFD